MVSCDSNTMVSLGQYVINCWSNYFWSKCNTIKSKTCLSDSRCSRRCDPGGRGVVPPPPPSTYQTAKIRVVQLLDERKSLKGCFESIVGRVPFLARRNENPSSATHQEPCPKCQAMSAGATTCASSPHCHANCAAHYWRYGFESAVYYVSMHAPHTYT